MHIIQNDTWKSYLIIFKYQILKEASSPQKNGVRLYALYKLWRVTYWDSFQPCNIEKYSIAIWNANDVFTKYLIWWHKCNPGLMLHEHYQLSPPVDSLHVQQIGHHIYPGINLFQIIMQICTCLNVSLANAIDDLYPNI